MGKKSSSVPDRQISNDLFVEKFVCPVFTSDNLFVREDLSFQTICSSSSVKTAKDCCFVRFILRQMISRCQVCVFGPSHWPSRSRMKIYLDLTFPLMCASGNASRRLC